MRNKNKMTHADSEICSETMMKKWTSKQVLGELNTLRKDPRNLKITYTEKKCEHCGYYHIHSS